LDQVVEIADGVRPLDASFAAGGAPVAGSLLGGSFAGALGVVIGDEG
jgi:hypothetical protein